MSDFQQEMDRVVQGFVSQISDLARRAALETIEKSLGKSGARGAIRVSGGGRGRGAKRSAQDLEQLSSQFVVVRDEAPRSAHRADQQGARHVDEGSRAPDPQAGRGRRGQDQGQEALDDVLREVKDTIPQRLLRQAAERPSTIAYQAKVNGRWQPTTWRTYVDQIRTCARALIALGLPRGGKVAILGFNRPEWVIFDDAAMMAGGAPAGIYTTCSPDEVQYIVHHGEALVVLVENADQWRRSRRSAPSCRC